MSSTCSNDRNPQMDQEQSSSRSGGSSPSRPSVSPSAAAERRTTMATRDELGNLCREIEEDTILGTCDWGSCSNLQVGWATSNEQIHADDDRLWLAICDPCRKRGDTKDKGASYPVEEFVSFAQAWRGYWDEPLAAFLRRPPEADEADDRPSASTEERGGA